MAYKIIVDPTASLDVIESITNGESISKASPIFLVVLIWMDWNGDIYTL